MSVTSRGVSFGHRLALTLALTLAVIFSVILIGTAAPNFAMSADKVPDPEKVTLEFKDGLQMKATFYPGTKGKETVPIIMLHGFKGTRKEFVDLATYLQAQYGHAVLLPDMRGHGESTKIKRGVGEKDLDVDAGKFKPADFDGLATDVEKMKQFLMEKHHAEQLNIDRLTVIGSELGADVAVKWARLDWSWPVLATGKQGQDVKALFLISPDVNFKGMKSIADYDDPHIQRDISFFIMAGKNGSGAADSKSIHNKLKPFHPDQAKDDYKEKQDLFFWQFDTALQGTKIFAVNPLKKDLNDTKEAHVDYKALVANFIAWRAVDKDYRWVSRKLAGQN